MMQQIEPRYNFNIIFSFFLFSFLSFKGNCQNSIVVYLQENSVLFSSEYRLDENNKTFEHIYSTDDGQVWYGKGEYFIRGNNIILNFKDSQMNGDSLRVKFKKDLSIKDNMICIRNIDFQRNKNTQSFIKLKDKIYYSDFNGDVLIDKKLFDNKNENITFLIENRKELSISLYNLDCINLLEIEGIGNLDNIHYESNFSRNLQFKNKFITSEDFYNTSIKKKVRFFKK